MNKPILHFIFLLLAFHVFLHAHSQEAINARFINHLYKNNLMTEQSLYLHKSSLQQNDSLVYYKTRFHLYYFNDSAFLHEFNSSKKFFVNDSCISAMAGSKFLHPNAHLRENWFAMVQDRSLKGSFNTYKIYQASVSPQKFEPADFDEPLQADFAAYKKADRKKPWVAGMANALIPGLGKLYIGRPRSFFVGLLATGLFALQTTESISKGGLLHPLTIVNFTLFGTFYVSNIIGTIKDTRTRKKELRNEFLINASAYYENRCYCSFY